MKKITLIYLFYFLSTVIFVMGLIGVFGFSVFGSSISFAAATENAGEANSSNKKTLPYFNKIILSGIGNLYITQSNEQSLSVKTEAALLSNIEAKVDNETLYLNFKNAAEHSHVEVDYFLNIKDLKYIESQSSSTVFIEEGLNQEGLNTEELIVVLKSFGEMNIKMMVDKLTAEISGAGRVKASGRAKTQDIVIKGAGEFLGAGLNGDAVSLNIDGTGIARVKASDTLSITITKEGTVRYCGNPKVDKNVSKTAVVVQSSRDEC